MVIRQNLMAMNANRVFRVNTRKLNATVEKLSSGYSINRAADDAAGLSISEKMRKQIRGLQQGERNIMQGISMLQVADGALDEVHSMLQRMNQLSVQAANGTGAESDRADLQMEIDALVSEIDRIGKTTAFNEIKLFQGRKKEGTDKGNGIKGRDIFVKGKPTDVNITAYQFQTDAVRGITVNGTAYAWSDIKNQNGESLAMGVKAGMYSFAYNGMNVEIGVSAGDTLDKIAEDIRGLSFQTNPASSTVKNIAMGKTASISLLYINDERNYVNLNHSGICEIKADQSGITITNKKTNASSYLDFRDVGNGYTQSYEDLMNSGTVNNLTFEFYDTQYTISLDLDAGWTKTDVIAALNHATYETGFSGNVADHYTTMPNGAGIYMNGFDCNFDKSFYLANGCDAEKLNIENPFVGSFISDPADPYQYSIKLEKDGHVNTFVLDQAGRNRMESIGRNGCAAGETISLTFEDGNGNKINTSFETTAILTYASITSYLNSKQFENIGNSIYTATNFVKPTDQRYEFDLSKKNSTQKVSGDGHQIRIQCSDAVSDCIILDIDKMDAAEIGVDGLLVNTQDTATASIDSIAKAIGRISEQRSKIGGQQNRLEHSLKINTNTAENTQYAESQIRDADMAELMIEHANARVLSDVAQTMLAHANQDARQVLSMLS